MVDVGTQCSDGSSGNPLGSRRIYVHGYVEHRFGCVLELLNSLWSTTEKALHINVLELEAIHLTVLHWLKQLKVITVVVAPVNSTVVSYINKQGRTQSASLCRQNKRLLLVSEQ